MKRGTIIKDRSEFVGLWIPKELVRLIDHGVRRDDLDRSKFVRAANREKIARGFWILTVDDTANNRALFAEWTIRECSHANNFTDGQLETGVRAGGAIDPAGNAHVNAAVARSLAVFAGSG